MWRFSAPFRCLEESTQCLVWNHKSLEKFDAMFFTSKHFTMLVRKAMHLIWFPGVLFRQDSVQHISIVNSSIELFSMNIWNRFLPFLYSKLNKYSLFLSKTIPWKKGFFSTYLYNLSSYTVVYFSIKNERIDVWSQSIWVKDKIQNLTVLYIKYLYIRYKNPKIKNGFKYGGTHHRLHSY